MVGPKPLIFLRFHGVFLGSQHKMWSKLHNGKVRINGPGHEAMAKASLVPPGLRHEWAVAIPAPMEGSEIADNPSLDATRGDAEV